MRIIVLIICVFMSYQNIYAQKNNQYYSKSKKAHGSRILNRHQFIPSDNISDPFINTYFGSNTGTGFASTDINIDGLDPFEANMAAFQQGFESQIRLHEYFALKLSTNAFILTGTNEDTVLILGTVAQADYGIGAKTGVTLGDFALGLAIDYQNNMSYQASPFIALVNASRTGRISAKGMLIDQSESAASFDLQAAYGFNRMFGLFAHTKYTAMDNASIELGLALSIDLRKKVAPIGFLLNTTYQSSSLDTVTGYGLGIFYTGRENLALGTEVSMGTIESSDAPNSAIDLITLLLRLRYYW